MVRKPSREILKMSTHLEIHLETQTYVQVRQREVCGASIGTINMLMPSLQLFVPYSRLLMGP